MIYLCTTSLRYLYKRYAELSATLSDLRWFALNGIYYLSDTPTLEMMKTKYRKNGS